MIKDLGTKEGRQLLCDNYIGHLAFISGGWPHSIPITFYYSDSKNTIISYAAEGHKIKAMRQNPKVSLEVNEIDSVSNWRSVLVYGEFEELHGIDAKYYLHEFAEGVKSVIQKKESINPQAISEFSSRIETDQRPVVYRIVLYDITAKFRED